MTQSLMGQKPSEAALENWWAKVRLLEPWEQQEIEQLHRQLKAILVIYQSSAALAIVRAALEVGLVEGQ